MKLQYLLEHCGIAVSAISGVLAARGKQVDLFGVLVMALVTAFGGGTVRDLMLGDLPVAWVRDSNMLLNACVTAVATFFIVRFRELPRDVLLVADAFALALFTVVGVRKALGFEVAPSVAVAMGVITGVFGGMMRDVLTGEIPLVFRRQIYLYATAALCGGLAFLGLNHLWPEQRLNMVLAAATTLLLRLAAIRWKVGLPEFKAHNADDGP